MDSSFLLVFGVYLLIFLYVAIRDTKKVEDFKDYAVAGKRQGSFAVTMTLLATALGASTTIGITDTVDQIGFPGVWWLLFGAVGLIFQSFILSEKVRKIDADTLPDMAGRLVGKPAELLLALIIVISWIGVIAGQFVALSSVITYVIGRNSKTISVIVSVIVILYTVLGGQLSVIKTDRIQFFIIVIGVLITLFYLYYIKGGNTSEVVNNIELLNSNYRPINLFTQFFVIGGVYFLGPDIMSRNFLAKDEKAAKKSALFAGILLAVFSVVITMIGMWVRFNVSSEELGDNKALLYVVSTMPRAFSAALILGLISAILSSTDTCIINASTIFVKDILKKDSVKLIRITVAFLGGISLVLAISGRGDIMSLLTGAYSIYTPGIIFPLFIAIMVNDSKRIRMKIWLTAVVIGGLFGIAGTYFGNVVVKLGVPEGFISYLPLTGMFISLAVALISVKRNEKSE
ncbi:MAG: sodium:solute symporter family protein [Eubacterium sp.]|nr:sodium:solute symporter family protein [Eubacterium sp.]